ncbi:MULTISPECIES: DUF5677 domain-containing protein [unclassified Leptospira]|uniref:DUF5677 domain-containing protein n=1 Tax=unclassified Leptospira TaxID=2633828 RepID=UPI0012F63A9D|nr:MULTISPECIES: DUF5677 domain-containing protein [unclassified Leptospira]MCR1795750.1 hypothetical protein [Leptospira sp. id769339]
MRETLDHFLRTLININLRSIKNANLVVGDQKLILLAVKWSFIIEYANSIMVLLRTENEQPIFGLLRSMVESYVDFRNLMTIPDYEKSLEIENAQQREKQLKYRDRASEHPLVKIFFPSESAIDQEKLDIAKIKKVATEQNIKSLKIIDKFQKAQMEPEYYTIYSHLSSQTHGNLLKLLDKKFNVNNGTAKIRVFTEVDDLTLSPLIDMTAGILASCVEAISNYRPGMLRTNIRRLKLIVKTYRERIQSF